MKSRGASIYRRARTAAQRSWRARSLSRRWQGFTLIEVMVVIALLGGLAAILAYGASRALLDRAESPEDVFWAAVNETRKQALLNEVDITLSFVPEDQLFRATALGEQRDFPVPLEQPIGIEFLGVAEGAQSIMIGGRLVEANLIPRVTFYRDGTCQPFRARLSVEGTEPMLFEIDPWTCAPILRDEEGRF